MRELSNNRRKSEEVESEKKVEVESEKKVFSGKVLHLGRGKHEKSQVEHGKYTENNITQRTTSENL